MLNRQSCEDTLQTVEYISVCYNLIKREIENICYCMSRVVCKTVILEMQKFANMNLIPTILSASAEIVDFGNEEVENLKMNLATQNQNEKILTQVLEQLKMAN